MKTAKFLFAAGLPLLAAIVGQRLLFAQGNNPILNGSQLTSSSIEGVPCGAEQYHTILTHKGEHPLPAPSENKALIFVLFEGGFGKSYQRKIAIDHRRWVSVLGKSDYTFFEVDPGTVTLSYYYGYPFGIGSGFFGDKQLEVKANQTYYIRESQGGTTSQVSEAEAAKLLKKLDYATFEPKGKLTEEEWLRFDDKFLKGWGQLRQGMTPQEAYDSIGLAEFGLLDKDMNVSEGTVRTSQRSVTISGNIGRVISCGYIFEFQRVGPSPMPGLPSPWRLQSWTKALGL
jgi:hypothetical protein